MFIEIIISAAVITSAGFLIFAFYGFHREAKNIRTRNKASVVHRLNETKTSTRQIVSNSSIFLAVTFLLPTTISAQSASVPSAPLPMPAMTGPLAMAPPATLDAGRYFGNLDVTGILSGFGYLQNNHSPQDHQKDADISNAQIFVQKQTGLVQFYLQAGAYNIPALGSSFVPTGDTVTEFYGAFPQGYIKLAPKGRLSFIGGKLPTLVGAEYTFTFENLNIERGLLWNQENAVNRGLQVNYNKGKISSSLAWSDGFYSNRYNWLSGMLTYASNASNSIEFVAMGNYGKTRYARTATPIYQNNSSIYNLIYTHTAKKWILQPYVQATYVQKDASIGVRRGTATIGGAILGDYTVTPRITLTARGEYIDSTGSDGDGAVNLMYGIGSGAFSATVTPTFVDKAFFARVELSVVHVLNATPGDVFGANRRNTTQTRGIIEAGFDF